VTDRRVASPEAGAGGVGEKEVSIMSADANIETTAGTVASASRSGRVGDMLRAPLRGLYTVPLGFAQIGVLTAFMWSVCTMWTGLGMYGTPRAVRMQRHLANRARQRAARWGGVSIDQPYHGEVGEASGLAAHFRLSNQLLTERSTWRDAGWLALDPIVGPIIALVPIGLVVWGLFGIAMPAVWSPIAHAGNDINNWYGFIKVDSAVNGWLCVPVGLACLAAGLLSGRWWLRLHARWTGVLLAPTSGDLAARVRALTESRTETTDARAAELRRIERDLHDGAQARLVALGMNLAAARRLMAENPDAAAALISEAQAASSTALRELRDLVRGIHPPVLADRGLVDAVRALALDTPLPIAVTAELSGRPPLPIESAGYFATAEILANVVKHADATRMTIDLRHEHGMLTIIATDDGKGGANASAGSGLAGIERRIAAFDGVLAIVSPVGGPTMITMEIPCALS
jgi:signal transduction histidine kinase